MSRAEAALAQVAATVPVFETQIVAKENQLTILLGRNPGAMPRGRALAAQRTPPALPIGLPLPRPPADCQSPGGQGAIVDGTQSCERAGVPDVCDLSSTESGWLPNRFANVKSLRPVNPCALTSRSL